jgi:surface carbohydrate biosynthesis protein
MSKQTVFLPVEVISRELTSRAFLSTKLANNGQKIYIFEHTFFDRNGWNQEGIYIGKNCFRTEVPYDKKYYMLMKKAGISIWYLDEEGGIYTGNTRAQKNRLLTRLTPSDLRKDDKILSWGNWQKNVFLANQPLSPIEISGNPGFDIIQPRYHESFQEFDASITNGLKDFILINTRFSLGNPKKGFKEIFGADQPYAEDLPKLYLEESYISDNKMMCEMVELCFYLSKKLPNEHIVIRPHPAEDIDIYKTLTKKFNNISVIFKGGVEPWIRRCKVLIHNGCTTAIQADIANKKVISFLPKSGSLTVKEYVCRIPNQIGLIASNNQEVLEAIGSDFNSSIDIYKDTVSELNSIDFITKLVQHEIHENKITLNRDKYDLFIKEKIRDLARKTISYLIPNKKQNVFNFKEFSQITNLVEIANHHYKSNVKCEKITEGCYVVYK